MKASIAATLRFLAVSVAGLVISGAAYADSLNIVTNFNAPTNPASSALFSYGWFSGSSFTAFTPMAGSVDNVFGASSEYVNNGLNFPAAVSFIWNGTGAAVQGGTVSFFTDYVTMGAQVNGADIRYTAPSDGIYSITGNFIGSDTSEHPTTDSVLKNGTVLMTTTVSDYLALSPIALSGLSLHAGDVIDFVSFSPVGDCCNLSVGVNATLSSPSLGSSAPEPATWILIPAALAVLLRRKRTYAC